MYISLEHNGRKGCERTIELFVILVHDPSLIAHTSHHVTMLPQSLLILKIVTFIKNLFQGRIHKDSQGRSSGFAVFYHFLGYIQSPLRILLGGIVSDRLQASSRQHAHCRFFRRTGSSFFYRQPLYGKFQIGNDALLIDIKWSIFAGTQIHTFHRGHLQFHTAQLLYQVIIVHCSHKVSLGHLCVLFFITGERYFTSFHNCLIAITNAVVTAIQCVGHHIVGKVRPHTIFQVKVVAILLRSPDVRSAFGKLHEQPKAVHGSFHTEINIIKYGLIAFYRSGQGIHGVSRRIVFIE